MLNEFNAHLEARNPARGHFRSYQIDAGRDLLGQWLVDVTYGRIGSRGHLVRHVVEGDVQARSVVKDLLRRRSSARRRIGTSYELVAVNDPADWLEARR